MPKVKKKKENLPQYTLFNNPIMYKINYFFARMNSNTYFIGIIVLLLNIFAKFITIELSPTQKLFIRNNIGRQVIIFSTLFLSTRNIVISFILTAVFIVLSDFILNENSKFCLMPKKYKKMTQAIDANNDGKISDQEINHAIMILNKVKQQNKKTSNPNHF